MSSPDIYGFAIDDINEEKFWGHGLTSRQVRQVLDNPFVLVRNRPGRAAPLLLIGREGGGRCIAVPIYPTHDRLVWRPVTAWPCKSGEAAKLQQMEMKRGRK